MIENLYQVVDRLNVLWTQVEKECKGLVLKSDKCNLSTKRHGDGIRLHYKDKPISECKAQEKIEAAKELPKFREMLDAYSEELIKKALTAEEILNNFLKKG